MGRPSDRTELPIREGTTDVMDWLEGENIVELTDEHGSQPAEPAAAAEAVLSEVARHLRKGELLELSSIETPLEASPEGTRRRVMTLKVAPDAATEGARVATSRGAHIVIVRDADELVQRTLAYVIERAPEIVRARRQAMTEREIETLVDLYVTRDPDAEARAPIAMDNARERARFVSEVECLSSKEIADYAGHKAANASMSASRWKRQQRVFSVPWQGSEIYPAFQFRDGQPRPIIAEILHALPDKFTPWQTAFWFTSANGWLDGATPAERLDRAEAVVEAAKIESQPIMG